MNNNSLKISKRHQSARRRTSDFREDWPSIGTHSDRKTILYLRISSLTSGKSSKLDVSSMDLTWTGMAAGRSLMCSQSTPRKNPIVDRSSSMPRPLEPSRLSDSQQNLVMASRASSLMGTSAGKLSVSRQFITFLYVSCGFSLQNGGYPVDERKKMFFL